MVQQSDEEKKRDAELRRSWADFRVELSHRLDQHRPARSGQSDREWREPVYGWARNHLPDERNAVKKLAEREVDNQERSATKRGNRILREWADGQRPLFWADLGPLPIIVEKVRVRLDTATVDDVEDACLDLDAQGKATFDEVIHLTRALRDLARAARKQGFATVALLGNMNPRKPDDGGSLQPFTEDEDDADFDDEDF